MAGGVTNGTKFMKCPKCKNHRAYARPWADYFCKSCEKYVAVNPDKEEL